jgi:hypothetical protein
MPDTRVTGQDVIPVVGSNLRNREIRELEELIAEYEDVFATNSSNYGQTNRVYHHIDLAYFPYFEKLK